MPAKDIDEDKVPPTDPETGEVKESGPFHVDLPQFVQEETRRPRVRPLRPLEDGAPAPAGMLERLKSAATSWRVKGAIQKVLGVVPGGRTMHRQLQLRVGGLRKFEQECDTKVDGWRIMMEHMANARVPLQHACLLEMGTGWGPTFAVCLFLSGAEQVLTVDLDCHLDPALTLRMVERLAAHLPLIAKLSRRTDAAVRASHAKLVAALREGATIERATGSAIAYRAPADASRTALASNSIDVVFSNSVLEHLSGSVIQACFAESMRILRPGGIVFHSVNCGDHYAYADHTITQLHYLTYSDEEWQFWNNAFLYQNRLRAIDFTAMAHEAGFQIELDTSRAHPERVAQLEAIRVHERFAKYSRAQLAITSMDFIGRKPAADESGN